jgi:hypothetical protein
MLPRKYLHGLEADDFDIPGVFGVPHARVPGSWRVFCSYADAKRHKARLFASLGAGGQVERRRSWEWHHVVEGQHYADVDFSGRLRRLYADELPCVLIVKEEHTAYNRLLHIRETDELFREVALPPDTLARSAKAASDARSRAEHPRLRECVAQLRRLYRGAYAGDRVLTIVADNVFDDVLRQLH